MKQKIHPEYFHKTHVICACGNTFEIGSTEKEMNTEICSACHPLYSGKQKFVDTARRIDKFEEKVKKAAEFQKKKNSKKHK